MVIKLINNDYRFLEKFEAVKLPSGKMIYIKREMMLTIYSTNKMPVNYNKLKLEIYDYIGKHYKYLCDPLNFSNYNHYRGTDIESFRVCIPVWKSLNKK